MIEPPATEVLNEREVMSTTVQAIGLLNEMRASTALTITRSEAAAALGVDPRTVTVGVENGTIPAIKLGRRVLIPREKFLKLFEVTDD